MNGSLDIPRCSRFWHECLLYCWGNICPYDLDTEGSQGESVKEIWIRASSAHATRTHAGEDGIYTLSLNALCLRAMTCPHTETIWYVWMGYQSCGSHSYLARWVYHPIEDSFISHGSIRKFKKNRSYILTSSDSWCDPHAYRIISGSALCLDPFEYCESCTFFGSWVFLPDGDSRLERQSHTVTSWFFLSAYLWAQWSRRSISYWVGRVDHR